MVCGVGQNLVADLVPGQVRNSLSAASAIAAATAASAWKFNRTAPLAFIASATASPTIADQSWPCSNGLSQRGTTIACGARCFNGLCWGTWARGGCTGGAIM